MVLDSIAKLAIGGDKRRIDSGNGGRPPATLS